MNKNRQCVGTAKKGLAIATAATIAVGSISYAADAPQPQIETKGSLAGVFATTAQLGDEITESTIVLKGAKLADTADKKTAEETDTIDFDKLLMADVSDILNIRKTTSTEAEVVGQMRPSDIATIINNSGEWIEIESGSVKGFVLSKYCITGEAAKERYEEFDAPYIKSNVNTLNVRQESNEDSDILTRLSKGSCLDICEEKEIKDGWVPVIIEDTIGYVSSEFVEIIDSDISTALSAEEIEKKRKADEEAAKAAAEAAKATRVANLTAAMPATVQNTPVNANSEEVILLASLLQCESGNYEGMLAVGGVVLNRLRSGYSDSIHGVIFQKGQFSPARSGKLASVVASGPSQTALDAAKDALSGIDITGGCKSFRSASSGHAGTNIGGNVFF